MTTAFQPDGFQDDAFQISEADEKQFKGRGDGNTRFMRGLVLAAYIREIQKKEEEQRRKERNKARVKMLIKEMFNQGDQQ